MGVCRYAHLYGDDATGAANTSTEVRRTTGWCSGLPTRQRERCYELDDSVLSAKINAVSYHKVRETIAAKAMQVRHEPTGSNLADILSKCLDGPGHCRLTSHILRQDASAPYDPP